MTTLLQEYSWHNEEYFPKNNKYQCPPIESSELNGFLYRFQMKESPTINDFEVATCKSYFREKNKNHDTVLCQGSGLLSFLSYSDAQKSLKRLHANSPGMRKKFKYIGETKVTPDDGLINKTPSNNTTNHHTYWCKKGSDLLSNTKTKEI